MSRRHWRRTTAAVLLTVGSAALAACGGSSGASGGDGGTTKITVGYFPLVHTATAVHALESGIFDEHGLDVELAQTAGGAQALPSLMAGEYDITYGNYTSTVIAAQQGLPVRILAGNDIGANDHGIMVNADSPLQDAADLANKTVAVNNLQNIGTVAVNAIVDDAGADPSTIDYVELPLPDMQAALDRGDVDAIWQVEPFLASSKSADDKMLFKLFSGPVADMPVAGWLTTSEFAEQNPEAVSAFQQAMQAAADELRDNRQRLVQLVPTYTEVPADVVAKVEMPVWDADPKVERLQTMSGLMADYGIIDKEFAVSQIILDRP